MISVSNLSLSLGGSFLFEDISFVVSDKERVALAGKNGAGKSTLLKILAGRRQPTSGSIAIPKAQTIGYLPQVLEISHEGSLLDYLKEVFVEVIRLEHLRDQLGERLAERADYDSPEYLKLIEQFSELETRLSMHEERNYEERIEKVFTGLGFEREQLQDTLETLSGGWRMRLELAKILLSSPDILLLDEPTNHLDLESIQWLEQYIRQSGSSLILVSHDRAFLDRTTTRTLELELGALYDYKVNYSHYLELREERILQQQKAYENQQKQIKDTEAFIERFRYKPSKSRQVQSRIKQLDKLDRVEVDSRDRRVMNIRFRPSIESGRYPIVTEHLGKSYGEHLVFSDVNITIERGRRVALVGKNGAGKSTFIKCLMGDITDYEGKVEIGLNVQIGYFAQDAARGLDEDLTVYETIDREAVGDIRLEVNNLLGAFMFGGELAEKKISVLSGGERGRVALLKLLLHPQNVLILDEPTNHLDIQSKEVLKEALLHFTGTLILVSHDRDFLSGLVDEVYEFAHHRVTQYLGGVEDWLLRKSLEGADKPKEGTPKVDEKEATPSQGSLDYEAQKALSRERRNRERAQKELEEQIEQREAELILLEEELAGSSSYDEERYKAHHELKEKIQQLWQEWEALSELLS